MDTLFFKLTKFLSIKNLIYLGVVIMGIMILLFSVTMFYLSTTIKYDQNTMKHVLSIEEQNKHILDDIKDIDALDMKILTSKSIKELETIEDVVIDNTIEHEFIKLSVDNPKTSDFNHIVNNIKMILNLKYTIQEQLLSNQIIILEFEKELQSYKENFSQHLDIVHINADAIYGVASLKMKRFNKKIIENKVNHENINKLKLYSKTMAYAKELDSSVVKLSDNINAVLTSKSLEKIDSISKNKLSQNMMLGNSAIAQFLTLDNSEEYKIYIDKIKEQLTDFTGIINAIVTLKKLQITQFNQLEYLLEERTSNNEKIYSSVIKLNDISKQIKYDILQHSDTISQRSAIIIVSIGVFFLFVISIAASILVYRINYPLSNMVEYIQHMTLKKDSLSTKLPIYLRDEFGKLSLSFNSMTSKLSKSFQKIQNLHEEIQDTQKEVIFTMGAIGESRSKETGNHVKRVAEYSKLLALYSGLPEDEAEMLKQASPMHDIGKVAIPDAVLNKPGRFNEEERKIMDTHAELGYEMLKHSHRPLLQCAATVAFEHHEKWDGTGYPRALKGENIHIYGRITALADVFDALGSDRCYKKAWEDERIFSLFKEERAKHFDPKLIDIFFEHVDEFLEIRNRLKDTFV